MGEVNELQVGYFIDAENMSNMWQSFSSKWDEIITIGNPVIVKAYAEWKWPLMQSCKTDAIKLGMELVQQDSYSKGKNSSDIAITIGVIESVMTRTGDDALDVVVLATEDSDFTPLVEWLALRGIAVVIIGGKKVSKYLVSKAHAFLGIETNIDSSVQNLRGTWKKQKRKKQPFLKMGNMKRQRALVELIPYETEEPTYPMPESMLETRESFLILLAKFRQYNRSAYKEFTSFSLPRLGDALVKFDPGFKPQTYGKKKLTDLVKDFPLVCPMGRGGKVELSTRLDSPAFVALLDLEFRSASDPSYNGFQSLSTFMRRFEVINPDLKIDKDEVILSLSKEPSFVHIFHIGADYVLWFHKGVATNASPCWLAGLQLLLRGVELYQRQWGQSVKMSKNLLYKAMNIGGKAYWAQYGANSYEQFLAQYDCLIDFNSSDSSSDDEYDVYLLGSNGTRLYSQYESNLAFIRNKYASELNKCSMQSRLL